MNIYQRIVLVIGGIGMAVVIFMTLQRTLINPYKFVDMVKSTKGMEGVLLVLKYDYTLAIIKSAIVAALTFSAYIGLGLIPRKEKK
jgi:hypothetical protein